MIENMDEYTIPARYNPVINHYMAQGDFGYLKIDGSNFDIPGLNILPFGSGKKKGLEGQGGPGT